MAGLDLWLIHTRLVLYIRDCTMVSVYSLLLFGGGHITVDLSRGNFILSVDDGWIRFMADSHQVSFIRASLQEMYTVGI